MNNLYIGIDSVISEEFIRNSILSFLPMNGTMWGARVCESPLYPTRIRGLSLFYKITAEDIGTRTISVFAKYHTRSKVRRPFFCFSCKITLEEIIRRGPLCACIDAVLLHRLDIVNSVYQTITNDLDYMGSWKQKILAAAPAISC